MKKILITCGPTNEYIDEVMKITNMSTGRLGVELSRELSSRGHEITLICTRSVARGGLYERYGIANNPNVRTVQIETTEQMYNALEAEKDTQYDLVVHAAAVGDYKADFSFRMEDMAEEIAKNVFEDIKEDIHSKRLILAGHIEDIVLRTLTNPKCKVNDDTKISSYEPNLTVKLGLTPKLISHLKEWFPGAILVGFKLLENVSKEHIIEVATKLCNKNDMNYIIANDLHDLRQGKHISYLCNKDGYCNFDFHSPDDIANKIISFVEDYTPGDEVLEFDNKLQDLFDITCKISSELKDRLEHYTNKTEPKKELKIEKFKLVIGDISNECSEDPNLTKTFILMSEKYYQNISRYCDEQCLEDTFIAAGEIDEGDSILDDRSIWIDDLCLESAGLPFTLDPEVMECCFETVGDISAISSFQDLVDTLNKHWKYFEIVDYMDIDEE